MLCILKESFGSCFDNYIIITVYCNFSDICLLKAIKVFQLFLVSNEMNLHNMEPLHKHSEHFAHQSGIKRGFSQLKSI